MRAYKNEMKKIAVKNSTRFLVLFLTLQMIFPGVPSVQADTMAAMGMTMQPTVPATPLILSSPTQNFIPTVQSGNWNDPATWLGGMVPGQMENVIISKGTVVRVDSSVTAGAIWIDGTLTLDSTNGAVNLNSNGSIVVANGGLLTNRGTGKVTIGFNETDNSAWCTNDVNDPDRPNCLNADGTVNTPLLALRDHGLWGLGGGAIRLTGNDVGNEWTLLTQDANAGSNVLHVEDDLSDWPVGAKIIVTTTSGPNGWDQTKIATIMSKPGSKTLVLDKPLQNLHLAELYAVNQTTSLARKIASASDVKAGEKLVQVKAAVGLLDRSLTIQSNLADLGNQHVNHTLCLASAICEYMNVALRNLGPEGLLGRYALHFHHLMAPGATMPGMSIFSGGSIYSDIAGQPMGKAAVYHGTDGAIFEDSVVYNVMANGAFYHEDRNNRNDIVRRSLFAHIVGKDLTPNSKVNKLLQVPDEYTAAIVSSNGNNLFEDLYIAGMDFGPETRAIRHFMNLDPTAPATATFRNIYAIGGAAGIYFHNALNQLANANITFQNATVVNTQLAFNDKRKVIKNSVFANNLRQDCSKSDKSNLCTDLSKAAPLPNPDPQPNPQPGPGDQAKEFFDAQGRLIERQNPNGVTLKVDWNLDIMTRSRGGVVFESFTGLLIRSSLKGDGQPPIGKRKKAFQWRNPNNRNEILTVYGFPAITVH